MSKLCQSCGMPLREEKFFSTNKDGSQNINYCLYCYDRGGFIDGCNSLNEKIEYSIKRSMHCGISKEDAEDMANNILPTLDRWKK